MTQSPLITIAAVLPQWSAGVDELASGFADFVAGSDEGQTRVQVIRLEVEDLLGADFTPYEGILVWLPESIGIPTLRVKQTSVLWSLFSSYSDRYANSLFAKICQLREKVNADRITVVRDASAWGAGPVVKGVIEQGCEHHVLDGDARQHSRILSRRSTDNALASFLKASAGSLVVCSDGNVAQRVTNAAEGIGIAIPDDLALVSLTNDAVAATNGISAFQVPFSRIACHAIASLNHRLLGKSSVPRLSFPWRLFERRSTLDSKTVGPLAFRAFQLIEREAGQGLTFDEVVRQLGVAHRTLSRQFTSAYGITPSRHIRNVKLSLANTLLSETDERVGEIASRCGFSDASKFCVFYKRETGRTPSEFRDSISAEQI